MRKLERRRGFVSRDQLWVQPDLPSLTDVNIQRRLLLSVD